MLLIDGFRTRDWRFGATDRVRDTGRVEHVGNVQELEVRLQERLQDTPKGAKGLVAGERSSAASRLGGLVPDDAAHPLSFTKTTMAALALLSLPQRAHG